MENNEVIDIYIVDYLKQWRAAILCWVMPLSPNKIYINKISILAIQFNLDCSFIESSVQNKRFKKKPCAV